MWKNENTDSGILRGSSFVALGSWIHERMKTFFLWSRFSLGRMRSVWKCSSPALNQRMRLFPLSRREGVICWKMDSATSPSAPRRMTGWGVYCEEWKFSKLRNQTYWETKHTNQKGNWCYVYRILMMLGISFFDWFMCWLFNKSGSYRGVCSLTH